MKKRVYREPRNGKPSWTLPPVCFRRPRSPMVYRARESNSEIVPEMRLSRMAGSV